MELYNLLKYLSVLFLLLYFIKGNFELSGFIRSIRFINNKNKNINSGDNNDFPFIYILLPVLREQKVIEETIYNFLRINYPASRYKIIVISTEKEIAEKEKNKKNLQDIARNLSKGSRVEKILENYLGILPENKLRELHERLCSKQYDYILTELKKEYHEFPTTIELVEKLKSKIDNKRLELIHYPYKEGDMAHQLNYACEILTKDKKNFKKNICIYNADSKIGKDTFLEVAELINKHKGKDCVIQQSAVFLKNYKKFNDGINRFFVYAAGLFQSHWTLSTEIPRIIRQSYSVKNKNVKLAHCVGHGLFIELGLFKKLGFLPVKTLNEDLSFGFILSAKKIPIYPLKSLEIADTPETLSSLINQKKVWFHSYLEYYKARSISLRHNTDKRIVNILFIRGSIYGISWLLNSYLLIVPIIFSLVYRELDFFYITLLFLLIYNFIPYYSLLGKVEERYFVSDFSVSFSFFERVVLSFFSVLIFFTDSIGPTLSVFERFVKKINGKKIKKKKTER